MLHTARQPDPLRRGMHASLFVGACALVAASAIVTREAVSDARAMPALVAIEPAPAPAHTAAITLVVHEPTTPAPAPDRAPSPDVVRVIQPPVAADRPIRWFDARPVEAAETVWLTVTAYSPDERSCGPWADGRTATLHSVWTNGMRLVAADPEVFAYGSLLSIPGYADQAVVPVLDCGGAIKGQRLDVLMPTHEEAMAWGVRHVPVTVWRYADGKPAPDPRRVR